jgi:hypothetical protein
MKPSFNSVTTEPPTTNDVPEQTFALFGKVCRRDKSVLPRAM